MERRIVPAEEYPWWVRLSMWGVPGRAGLWFFFVFSLVCAAACGVYGFLADGRFFLGTLVALAALPYWFTIQWVDRHGSWQADR